MDLVVVGQLVKLQCVRVRRTLDNPLGGRTAYLHLDPRRRICGRIHGERGENFAGRSILDEEFYLLLVQDEQAGHHPLTRQDRQRKGDGGGGGRGGWVWGRLPGGK